MRVRGLRSHKETHLRSDRAADLIRVVITMLTADPLVHRQVTLVDGRVVLEDRSKVLDILGDLQGRVELGALTILHE